MVRRTGVPIKRIMAMRWIPTWKEVPEGSKTTSRLVAKGFTGPDLLTIRAEAPTLINIGRHCLLQVARYHKLTLEVDDASTAFFVGDKSEQNRDVYLAPTADLRQRLHITKDHVLKLTGSVYGLRHAPRAWYQRVKKDLEALGWRCHQLDQCAFLYYDDMELVGICGVYVDDFIIAGRPNSKKWQATKEQLKQLYKWGIGRNTFALCGVSYVQKKIFPSTWTNRNSLKNCQRPISTFQKVGTE